jgi:hypothetical protein
MGLFVSLAKGPIALLRSVTFPIRIADFKVSNHSPLSSRAKPRDLRLSEFGETEFVGTPRE